MGGISRRTLIESQDIKESQVTGVKILDHTLGSQELGTTANIIVYATQIKDDLIGSEHIDDDAISYPAQVKDTVNIFVAGTQIKDDLIGSEHLANAAVSYAAQVKDAIITPAKFSELQEHGTVANVKKGGVYLTFDAAFGGTPDIVISPESGVGLGTFPYIDKKLSGSALLKLTADGTIVCDYIALGPRV